MVKRGEVWWGDLPEPRGAEPGFRRPLLVLQTDELTKGRLRTVVVAVITSNTRLANYPGNVYLDQNKTGLPKDSVVNLTQLYSIDKEFLGERVGQLPQRLMDLVEEELCFVLAIAHLQ